MFDRRKIRLFWFSEVELMGKSRENYGDLIGKYLAEKITRKKVVFSNPNKFSLRNFFQPIYCTAGSILGQVNSTCVVWGSGIIQKDQVVKPAKFLAVRGPQTRNMLIQQGYTIPKIYGDPALLLPKYYQPTVNIKYKIGIVPHYNDFEFVNKLYKDNKELIVIDLMTNDIEATTNLIAQCECIISSSLHGLIVSHTYGIRAVWVKFSDTLFGDGIKFQDYFESVEITPYIPEIKNFKINILQMVKLFKTYPTLPKKEKIDELKQGLMRVCPFI